MNDDDIHPSNITAARPHQHGAPEGEAAQVPQVRLRRRLQVVPHDAPPPTAPRLRALRHIRHRQQVEDGEARQGQEKLPQLKTLQVHLIRVTPPMRNEILSPQKIQIWVAILPEISENIISPKPPEQATAPDCTFPTRSEKDISTAPIFCFRIVR